MSPCHGHRTMEYLIWKGPTRTVEFHGSALVVPCNALAGSRAGSDPPTGLGVPVVPLRSPVNTLGCATLVPPCLERLDLDSARGAAKVSSKWVLDLGSRRGRGSTAGSTQGPATLRWHRGDPAALTVTRASCRPAAPPRKNALAVRHSSVQVRTNAKHQGFGRKGFLGEFQLSTNRRGPGPWRQGQGSATVSFALVKAGISRGLSPQKRLRVGSAAKEPSSRRAVGLPSWGCAGHMEQLRGHLLLSHQ